MANLSNHAAAAAAIRAELKKQGIQARVRSRVASMMDAVDVHIDQDVLPATRKAIEAFVAQFQYGHFDGMDDSYRYSNQRADLPQVKYAHVHVHYSAEILAELKRFAAEHNISHEWPVLCGSHPWSDDFWRSRKPKVRLGAAA